MATQSGPSGDIFDGFSPRGQRALADLRLQFQSAGFFAEKERRTERTLRVYPERRWRYPLLNPWLERANRLSPRQPAVICPLYSDGDTLIQRLLDRMPHAPGYSYRKSPPRRPGRYFLHGYVIVPLSFERHAGRGRIDFARLQPTLAALHLQLTRGDW